MINPQPSCTDTFEAGLLPVESAIKKIFATLPSLNEYECINIQKAKGRTLFENITASFNVPYQNNSAVDGYAFIASDSPFQGIKSLKIIGSAYAGKPYINSLYSGQCVRIMTGAAIPENADTVAMQEHIAVDGLSITIDKQIQSGQNIRLAGEDIKQGETILKAGKFITPADIGLMASLGIPEIKVKRKLTIAIASTGNEVVNIGEFRATSQLYDSNRYSLYAALDRPDIEIINLGILEDDPEKLLNSFNQISQTADMIISTGGVSVGDADHTKTALQQSGQIDFWKIAIKPGRPLAFGKLGNSIFFGLPGNPVAVMVTFYQFVVPALETMLGITDKALAPMLKIKSLENIRKKPGRTEIVRGILQQDNSGEWVVKTTGKQGSGILSSMSVANAFIILEHDRSSVKSGEIVTVQTFSGMF